MSKRIELSRGKSTIVDDSDFVWASKHKWSVTGDGGVRGYYAVRNDRGTIQLHRLIAGAKNGQLVDHINHDTLDNRRKNLRIATQQQNQRNRKGPQKNSKTGVLGVCWDKSRGKFMAHINIGNKPTSLGRFDDLADAIAARKKAEINIFGEWRPCRG